MNQNFKLLRMIVGACRQFALLMAFFCFALYTNAQDLQLLTEDFESGGGEVTLNDGGPGGNSGNNLWIVNNNYSGLPIYPNTTTQDNTVSGTIGFAPTSNYLHIHNQPSGITNNNYDPGAASDRFTHLTFGLCTYGMTDVHFSFFYLCEGTATAYGTLYYSADGGAWTQIGPAQYNNSTNWQFEDITSPAFSNVGSLSFGFRWQNDTGATPFNQSFSIDDINVVASYSSQDPVTITITSVAPNPVCEGSFLTISYELSDTLCDGNYQLELSSAAGNFPSAFNSWVLPINYPTTSGSVTILLPAGASDADCYRVRINRLSPDPQITGISSDCIEIIECPNVINTMQPVVTMDPFPVCVGSVIDIPFTSTGIYANNNTYICQLSEIDGTFAANPPVVGTFNNNGTYDPALGQLPGNVSGLIPDADPGCNYYIRVISTNPSAIGSIWGPFCIQRCDIETNNTEDIGVCVYECSVDPDGENILMDIDINTNGNNATYLPGNQFTTQLFSSMTFGQIGSNGILGSVNATTSTQLNIHIPCKDSLDDYGIPLGMNYLRVVATNSNQPQNALGSLIRLTVGAYHNDPQTITSYEYPTGIARDTFCIGETVMLLFAPFNPGDNSTFMWQCNGINGGAPFVSPSGATSNSLFVTLGGAGILTFSIQETNYGCVGEWTPPMQIVVLGDPVINITGPPNICLGDTSQYVVTFAPNTYYSWSTTANVNSIAYQDTSNNVMNIAFSAIGNYTLNISVLNQCGSDDDNQIVHVLPFPIAEAGPNDTICINQSTLLTAQTGPGYTYEWSQGSTTLSNTNTVTVSPTITTSYIATFTGTGGCQSYDTVDVIVIYPDPPIIYTDSICPGGENQLTLISDSVGGYTWSTGELTNSIIVTDTGTYSLSVVVAGLLCPHLAEYDIVSLFPDPPNVYIDSICPGGNNELILLADSVGSYLWSTGSTSSFAIVNDVGMYSLSVNLPGPDCPHLAEYNVLPMLPQPPVLLYDSVCPNGNSEITLAADFPGNYAWSTGSASSNIQISDTGMYYLSIFIPNERCPLLFEYYVTPDSCYFDSAAYYYEPLFYYVPNAFTPSSNDINDVFGPVFSNLSILREYRFMIFNRWGEPVYVSVDPLQRWTGEFMGGDFFVEDGVYVWQLEFRNTYEVEKQKAVGHVTIVR